MDTNATSSVRHDVAGTPAVVPGVQNDAVNTHTMVSDSHRNTLKTPEGPRGQNLMVGTICTLPVDE